MSKPPKQSFGEETCHQICIFGDEINKIEVVVSKAFEYHLLVIYL
jgi:hypothetical protein